MRKACFPWVKFPSYYNISNHLRVIYKKKHNFTISFQSLSFRYYATADLKIHLFNHSTNGE